MDKMLWVAMSGAKQNLNAVSVQANNLANVKTIGFKADLVQARSMQAFGEGLPSRVFSMAERPSQNMSGGTMITTGRDLDIAIQGDGWMAVEDKNGQEAYTRNGNLQITPEGLLTTSSGQPVIGEGGPILLPIPVDKVEIGLDGAIVVRPQGAPANFLEEVDRIKLIKPTDDFELDKGNDGLFRPKELDEFAQCGFCEASPDVRIIKGALESSNVNAVSAMVDMVSLQRQFEMQNKMMKQAETIDRQSDMLMRVF
ncbi:cell-proximal portion of basal-body rod [Catenovulum agarivorans DS-2]|uniref:Flagellar basal-body rod protein FlgF n=1 Tax=Catenovulum agarivorans DS-2 TaxID=1328313 RepID=W7QAT5_9ALTE|nr:flagellar basal body rod protein FlgF [Catenovulum agarivorans]EWH09949.1 cell-proximal portion of basal-body rod [Catenovulum agarivorans DS-2]